jgi:hypothetical protein
LRSDTGSTRVWVNTGTGEFVWYAPHLNLTIKARGILAFPHLGPIILSYSGEVPGYDWVVLVVKIYGTSATGSLTAIPEGDVVRKIVSTLYDRDTFDDSPAPAGNQMLPTPPTPPHAPSMGTVTTTPPEIPVPNPSPEKTPQTR